MAYKQSPVKVIKGQMTNKAAGLAHGDSMAMQKKNPKSGKNLDEFGNKIPKDFKSDMGPNYDPSEASNKYFDDVRKADKAVKILKNVQKEGTSGFGYQTSGALNVLTGGPTKYENYGKRIKDLESKVHSDPRHVLKRINRNISSSGSDAAMDVAKEIDPTGTYADASMYGQTRHYRKDAKQDPRFANIVGQTKLEKKKNKKS